MIGSDNVCEVNLATVIEPTTSGYDSRIISTESSAGQGGESSDSVGATRICRQCRTAFALVDARRRFCSDRCQKESFRVSVGLRQAKHAAKHPDKVWARQTLKNAINLGHVRRCTRCEACGERKHTHGHHSDYAKPYYVTWLCSTCHAALEDGQHFGCGREKDGVRSGHTERLQPEQQNRNCNSLAGGSR